MYNIDHLELFSFAKKQESTYQLNAPFPHIVIDDFLPEQSYNKIKKAFPKKT